MLSLKNAEHVYPKQKKKKKKKKKQAPQAFQAHFHVLQLIHTLTMLTI